MAKIILWFFVIMSYIEILLVGATMSSSIAILASVGVLALCESIEKVRKVK